jgi:hypothetical protein
MLDRLDRTLNHFVDDGRIAPEVAAQISQEFHVHPVDVRQRLAELAGYAGAGLATVGLVIIGSQVWTDFSLLIRAAAPALVSAALLVGAWWLNRSVGHISEHPVRGRVAQTMGAASSVLALLAMVVAFSPESGDMPSWVLLVASSTALVISLVVWRWVPGFINTLACAVFAFVTGLSLMDVLGFGDGPAMALVVVGLGAAAALLLNKFFPPEWLTRGLGLMVWLQGTAALMTAELGYNHPDTPLRWAGRASALALIVIGAWLFARGSDWLWAIAAGTAAALLVGLWSLEAVNAGVALIIAGLVLIAAGLVLAGLRRAEQRAKLSSRS